MKNEVTVYIPELKVFLHVAEGSGDNLSREDRANGIIDYMCYYTYLYVGNGELVEDDGGQIDLTEYFVDRYHSEDEFIREAMEDIFDRRNLEYVMIEEGDKTLWN